MMIVLNDTTTIAKFAFIILSIEICRRHHYGVPRLGHFVLSTSLNLIILDREEFR